MYIYPAAPIGKGLSHLSKIQKEVLNIEVHERYGPSLRTMFNHIDHEISEQDFLLLLYQLVNK